LEENDNINDKIEVYERQDSKEPTRTMPIERKQCKENIG
jgi:hypothetical protein